MGSKFNAPETREVEATTTSMGNFSSDGGGIIGSSNSEGDNLGGATIGSGEASSVGKTGYIEAQFRAFSPPKVISDVVAPIDEEHKLGGGLATNNAGARLMEVIARAKERANQRRLLSGTAEEVRAKARALEELLSKDT